MKFLFAAIAALTLSISAFAEVRMPEDPGIIEPDQIDAMRGIEGNWDMDQRSCASGAPVRDSFVPGRDFMQISFNRGRFYTYADVNFCEVKSDGYYYEGRSSLTLDIMGQYSSCAPTPPLPARVSYQFRLHRDRLWLRMGPMAGGPCPRGDYYDLSYRRF